MHLATWPQTPPALADRRKDFAGVGRCRQGSAGIGQLPPKAPLALGDCRQEVWAAYLCVEKAAENGLTRRSLCRLGRLHQTRLRVRSMTIRICPASETRPPTPQADIGELGSSGSAAIAFGAFQPLPPKAKP
ncbi:hypothetical protein ACFT9M_18095 [Micromonospora purpureochromogenes]|uniref:hypothetical protein n=1 Tax=Micromonospora purpureochromogenes TaxID=47872 RepID=UPI00362D6FCA